MEPKTNVPLTATEMSNLWSSYIESTMAICVLQHCVQCNEDADIRPVLEYALQLSQQYLQTVKGIFAKETFPIPAGFDDDDLNLTAPRLFSDAFFLDYVKNMAKVGLATFGVALALSARKDIRDFYQECVNTSAQLYQMVADVLLSKGLFIRPPLISIPKKVSFITSKTFYGGLFGEQRPVTAIEIGHISHCLETNVTGMTLMLGFSQVTSQKKVRQHMIKGKDMAKKHASILSELLKNDDLSSPMTWAETVSESTTAPFSDKLMLTLTTLLTAAGTGNYGLAIAASPRKDIATTYMRLFTEAGDYAKDASDLMIDNGWLEQPPQANDRKALSRT